MEEQMPTRMTLFVPAVLTICLATVCLTVQPSRAADDCIARPNAPSPPGSHWYYRVDRAAHRECWYLAADGAKVHPRARQAVLPARASAPKATTRSTAQTPAEAVPAEITAGEARAAQDDATAASSMRWSNFPISAPSLDRGPVSMGNNYAEEQSTPDWQDDMPLIWPIMTPQDLAAQDPAAAGRAPQFTVTFAQLAAALATVLGLAALIARTLVRLSAARKPDRLNARDRWGSAAHQDMLRKPVKATGDPAVEIAASVRRLLRDLQQRRQADHRRDFQRTSRKVMA
jgi:hypothetical protein